MNTRKLKPCISSPVKVLDVLMQYQQTYYRATPQYKGESKADFEARSKIWGAHGQRLLTAIDALANHILAEVEAAYEPIYKEWNIEYEKVITRTETILAKDQEEAMKIAGERSQNGEVVASVEELKE